MAPEFAVVVQSAFALSVYSAAAFVQRAGAADSIVVQRRERKSRLLGLEPAFASIYTSHFLRQFRKTGHFNSVRTATWSSRERLGHRCFSLQFHGGSLNTTNERRYVNLPDRRGNLPFSDAVISGDTVYIAGRIGFKPGTTQVPDDPSEEARLMLEGVRSVLRESGSDMNDLVYVQIFCSDVSLFDTFNQVYRQYFSGALPARAFIGSGPLLFGARFEIIGIANRQSK